MQNVSIRKRSVGHCVSCMYKVIPVYDNRDCSWPTCTLHWGAVTCSVIVLKRIQQYSYAWYISLCSDAGSDTDTDSTDCDDQGCSVETHYALHTAQCWLHGLRPCINPDQLIVSDAECFDSVFFTFDMSMCAAWSRQTWTTKLKLCLQLLNIYIISKFRVCAVKSVKLTYVWTSTIGMAFKNSMHPLVPSICILLWFWHSSAPPPPP